MIRNEWPARENVAYHHKCLVQTYVRELVKQSWSKSQNPDSCKIGSTMISTSILPLYLLIFHPTSFPLLPVNRWMLKDNGHYAWYSPSILTVHPTHLLTPIRVASKLCSIHSLVAFSCTCCNQTPNPERPTCKWGPTMILLFNLSSLAFCC